MLKSAFLYVIFGIGKYICSIAMTNFIVASWMYVVATVIFIELIVEFRYGFLYSPNYLSKLIEGIKEMI
jgi:hypothetical protein